MNFPTQSKITDRLEKLSFPVSAKYAQKHHPVVGKPDTSGVIRDISFHQTGETDLAACPKLYRTDVGVSDGKTQFSSFTQAGAPTDSFVTPMETFNKYLIAAISLIVAAVVSACATYLKPEYGRYTGGLSVILLVVAAVCFYMYYN